MSKYVLVPDSFKGTMTSREICEIMQHAIKRIDSDAKIISVPVADGGEGSVYEHMKKILDFSAEQVGEHGVCLGLRADWNDCLNLGGGESALV